GLRQAVGNREARVCPAAETAAGQYLDVGVAEARQRGRAKGCPRADAAVDHDGRIISGELVDVLSQLPERDVNRALDMTIFAELALVANVEQEGRLALDELRIQVSRGQRVEALHRVH